MYLLVQRPSCEGNNDNLCGLDLVTPTPKPIPTPRIIIMS